MNNIYIYYNNFTSLLSLINYLALNKIKPFNIKNNFYSPTLLDNIINLDIENNYDYLKENLSTGIIKTMYYVYLTDDENKELIIYYFIFNALKYKKQIFNMRNLKCVNKSLKLAHLVTNENHRFKGFTRFKELENKVLYAQIKPDNNILELLSIHFKKRLKNEYWIIHDTKRNLLSIYDKKNFYLIDENTISLNTKLSNNEQDIQNLWKDFYKTIGIKERRNERCRMNFMPKKYWQNIIEMDDKNEKSN